MTAETEIQTDRHRAEMRERRAAEVDAQHEAAAAKQAERGKRDARQRVLDLVASETVSRGCPSR